MDATNGLGAEMVFDITGHPSVFHAAPKMLGKRGRLGLIGDVPKPVEQTMTSEVINKSISIITAHGAIPLWEGNHYYRWGKQEMTRLFFDFVLAKRFSVSNLITHRIDPTEAPALYEDLYLNRDKYMGVIIDWANAK
jgi:threonine dehydrogenase-like Zn-dependent dehydrogenase